MHLFLPNHLINGIAILTELNDLNGKSIIVAVHLDVDHCRHMVNAIASIYGKDNESNFVLNQISNGR